MRLKPAIVALAVLGMAAAAEESHNPLTKGLSDPNAPISYSADHFQADANGKTGVFYGNVIIRQGEVTLRADSVRFHVVDNKPDKVYARGNVVVVAPSGVATGDNGVYDVGPRIVTLTGHVVLTKDKSVMRGPQLTVDLLTGLATLAGVQGQGGRIQGMFSPDTNIRQGGGTTQNH